MPDPHLNDYIYQSLKQELAASESRLVDIKKQYTDFINKSNDPSLSTSDVKIARAKADLASREIRKLEQKVKYWRLKLLSREEVVRGSYLKAFNKGEEWNNDEEVQRFKRAQNRGKIRSPASSHSNQKDNSTKSQHEGAEAETSKTELDSKEIEPNPHQEKSDSE